LVLDTMAVRVLGLYLRRREVKTPAGNPGTEDGAVLDFFLLADSNDLIITSSSSFGFSAAGLAGLRAYYVTEHGQSRRSAQPLACLAHHFGAPPYVTSACHSSASHSKPTMTTSWLGLID
jgi:hypothetical protein